MPKPRLVPNCAMTGGFGPWSNSITDAERVARLRCLRALATAYGARDLVAALLQAERDPGALEQALSVLDRVPALRKRRLLSLYNVVAEQGRLA